MGKNTLLSKETVLEPIKRRNYTGLGVFDSNKLDIIDVKFVKGSNKKLVPKWATNNSTITDLQWFTFGQQILKNGKIVAIQKIMEQFYDVRHVFALDLNRDQTILNQVYCAYPENYKMELLKLWDQGIPRSRNLHSAIGLSDDKAFILQRFGTIEEIACWIKEAGARDAIILDNSGSVGCWAWWVQNAKTKGGYIYSAPDFRPNASSVIAFVLHGPTHINEIPGATSHFIG